MPKTSDDELSELLSDLHDKGDDQRPSCPATWGNNTMAACDCGVVEALQAINAKYIRRDIVAAALGGNNHAIREARRELGLEDAQR